MNNNNNASDSYIDDTNQDNDSIDDSEAIPPELVTYVAEINQTISSTALIAALSSPNPIRNHTDFDSISESTSTSNESIIVPYNMSASTSYTIGGLKVKADPAKVNSTQRSGILFPKELRPTVGSKAEAVLINKITTNHYEKYKFVSTSIKDVESLRNNLSITQRLAHTEESWQQTDMLQPCHIVFPDPANPSQLLTWNDGSDRSDQPKSMYLFKDFRRLTPEDVAASCKFYALYAQYDYTKEDGTAAEGDFLRELTWSYSHFRTHVESDLYEAINSEYKQFDSSQQGGPLFLKLLLDELTITNDASQQELITHATTYNIARDSDEDMIQVAKLLEAITDTISACRAGKEFALPDEYVEKMIVVFQTTSVPKFNESFHKLEEDIIFNRRMNTTNQSIAMRGHQRITPTLSSTTVILDNTPASMHFIFSMVRNTYKEMKEKGIWDAAMKTTETKQSSFTSQPTRATPPSTSSTTTASTTTTSSTSTVKCWNCGGDHNVFDCTEPKDDARIKANRAEFLKKKADRRKSRNRKPPHAWRAPDPEEGNKRTIYGKPYTWNPTRNGWDLDAAPDSGLDNNNSTTNLTHPSANLQTIINSLSANLDDQTVQSKISALTEDDSRRLGEDLAAALLSLRE